MIRVRLQGDNALRLRLSKGSRAVADLRPLWKRLHVLYDRKYRINMTSGVDPDGKPFPEVQRWTREVRKANTNSRVLHVTGTLRRSINTLAMEKDRWVYGPSRQAAVRAAHMQYGLPGRIQVSEGASRETIRHRDKRGRFLESTYKERKYIRIQLNDGSWRTKRIEGGSVSVKAQARRFMYISTSDLPKIRAEVQANLDRALGSGA